MTAFQNKLSIEDRLPIVVPEKPEDLDPGNAANQVVGGNAASANPDTQNV
jgi:hypothetical protein